MQTSTVLILIALAINSSAGVQQSNYDGSPTIDDICRQPKETGDCKALIPALFYNFETGQCEVFIYGGCGGNGNRFYSPEDCNKRCGNNQLPSDSDLLTRNDPCISQRVVGPCKARLQRWYFNVDERQCKMFYYGGCRGNENNFKSKQECEKKCFT
ncbi:hypothetical protein CHUAL_009824 [Chamberlinius hualienensis]